MQYYLQTCKEFEIPEEAVSDCSRPGDMGPAVSFWVGRINTWPTQEEMLAELKETGLEIEKVNEGNIKHYFLWVAACGASEEAKERSKTS